MALGSDSQGALQEDAAHVGSSMVAPAPHPALGWALHTPPLILSPVWKRKLRQGRSRSLPGLRQATSSTQHSVLRDSTPPAFRGPLESVFKCRFRLSGFGVGLERPLSQTLTASRRISEFQIHLSTGIQDECW